MPTTVMYGSHMSMLTASSSAALCGPSLRKNRSSVLALRSFPAQTTRPLRWSITTVNPNRKIFEARKRETAALGAGEKLVLGHPLAATIGDSARCMQNLEKVLFTGPKTSDTVTFICD